MKRNLFVTVACIAMLVCTEPAAQGKMVMFFEAAIAPTDTTLSKEPSGYSKLTDMLRAEGMLVASMSSGEITRQKLSPYEVVVLHPSPERPLSEGEISALVWFVAQKGGALLVHGGTAEIVNRLTEIFGISIDSSTLVVASSSVTDESDDGHKFILTRFPSGSDFTPDGIQSIGFYGGPPLVLSQDAVAVVTGGEDYYSDNGLYSIGSFPPVAAVAYLGRGVILAKSDRAMLNNANIEAYQNMEWSKAVFERLATVQETRAERDRSLFGFRSRVAELEKTVQARTEQNKKYERDLTTSYERIEKLQGELREIKKKNEILAEQSKTLRTERDRLGEILAKYRSPDTLRAIAIGAGIVLLVVLVSGVFIGRWSTRGRA